MFVLIVLNKINNIPIIIIPKILIYAQIMRDETDHISPFILLSDRAYRDMEKDIAEIIWNVRIDDLLR
jgi:hypothetical protein